ncbi:hypothetical protein GCK32_004544 [Trichostrongylus colubriformis]|uniref:Lipoprotein n=1 Tax=Trichostrongylus colubriformis TaxID=6319 RepID=A0AAN8F3T2_TRICO
MTKLVVVIILACVVGSVAMGCTRTDLSMKKFGDLSEDTQNRLKKRLGKEFESDTKIYKYKVDLEKDDGVKTFYPFFITPSRGAPIYLKIRGDIEKDDNVKLTLNFNGDDFNRLYSTCNFVAAAA